MCGMCVYSVGCVTPPCNQQFETYSRGSLGSKDINGNVILVPNLKIAKQVF